MNANNLINQINDRLNNNLNKSSSKKNDLKTVENSLLKMVDDYKKDIENLQKSIVNFVRSTKSKNIEISYYSFVYCVIGAKKNEWSAFGSSANYLQNYSKFPLLQHKLRRIGRIGARGKPNPINGHKNYIGKCAEVKAAYNLKSKTKITNLSSIEFTNAYRPRTKQIIDKCENCKYTF